MLSATFKKVTETPYLYSFLVNCKKSGCVQIMQEVLYNSINPLAIGAQLFLLIILCCWINASFTRKPLKIVIDESGYWSKILRATNFTKWIFQVFHWKFYKYWLLFRQKNYFTCNSLKRRRAELVGLPPAALGPQDIPYRRPARPEHAGALFRYINSLENLQCCLNLSGL